MRLEDFGEEFAGADPAFLGEALDLGCGLYGHERAKPDNTSCFQSGPVSCLRSLPTFLEGCRTLRSSGAAARSEGGLLAAATVPAFILLTPRGSNLHRIPVVEHTNVRTSGAPIKRTPLWNGLEARDSGSKESLRSAIAIARGWTGECSIRANTAWFTEVAPRSVMEGRLIAVWGLPSEVPCQECELLPPRLIQA